MNIDVIITDEVAQYLNSMFIYYSGVTLLEYLVIGQYITYKFKFSNAFGDTIKYIEQLGTVSVEQTYQKYIVMGEILYPLSNKFMKNKLP